MKPALSVKSLNPLIATPGVPGSHIQTVANVAAVLSVMEELIGQAAEGDFALSDKADQQGFSLILKCAADALHYEVEKERENVSR